MTREQAEIIARDIAEKSKSVFHTNEAIGWIASAIHDAAVKARKDEHDRIEKLIGRASHTKRMEMVRIAQFKWGGKNRDTNSVFDAIDNRLHEQSQKGGSKP